ncbi:MAG: dihydropteroate synthase [Luteolibacter sp.]
MIWSAKSRSLDLSRHGHVMGILNVTPDSFSDGGKHADCTSALRHARQLIAEGATIIDIGGESTRPGALVVPLEQEIARTAPVVEALRKEWDGLISIDTMKSAVAAAALEAGADIVNDISGLTADPAMAGICAEHRCAVVVMHMQGTPQTMQIRPHYDDLLAEVRAFFAERIETLTGIGISRRALCFDPGIGFGKTVEHNLTLIRHLDRLAPPDIPILLGVSRKSFIGKTLGIPDLSARDWPTVALTAYGREKGAMLHRVHAVRQNVEALRMTEAILGNGAPTSTSARSHLR